jgi:D-threonate/D-erythronate kinase
MDQNPIFYILSDDLTGASGVASMIDSDFAITVNAEHLKSDFEKRSPCICVNLRVRESNSAKAAKAANSVLDTIGDDSIVTLRIDSSMRGPIDSLVGAIARRRRILLTDTIPEYGRYTSKGATIFGRKSIVISRRLSKSIQTYADRITIADSYSSTDLKELAKFCVKNGLIPVDPGPLISNYFVLNKNKSGTKLQPKRPRAKIKRVGFLIGTNNPVTLRQIQVANHFMRLRPVESLRGPEDQNSKVDAFVFSLKKARLLMDRNFFQSLVEYDALFLSGGETANYILEKSGFQCILNYESIEPLVSTGVVQGGLFDGKLVVLKGGSIGDDNMFKRIRNWMLSYK